MVFQWIYAIMKPNVLLWFAVINVTISESW